MIQKSSFRAMQIFFPFLFLLIAISSSAQDQNLSKFLDDFRVTQEIHNKLGSTINSYDMVEGSPYLYPDFREALIQMDNGIQYRGKLRYDLYTDEMEFMLKDHRYWLGPKVKIEKIVLDGRTFVFLTPAGTKKGRFLELLVDGPCRLLADHSVDFIDAEEAKPYQDARPARFSRKKTTYYFQKGKDAPELIRNKKSLLHALGPHADKIATRIKKEHLSVTRREDLQKIITYCNDLSK